VNIEMYLTFEITFGDPGILQGEAVVPTLEYFSASVESLAAVFVEEGLLK
jgi:hypothetical protein